MILRVFYWYTKNRIGRSKERTKQAKLYIRRKERRRRRRKKRTKTHI
jgi:hypothetical protein